MKNETTPATKTKPTCTPPCAGWPHNNTCPVFAYQADAAGACPSCIADMSLPENAGIKLGCKNCTPAWSKQANAEPKPAPLLTLFKLTHTEGPVEILAINRAYQLTVLGGKMESSTFLMLADGSLKSARTDEGTLTLHTPRPAKYSDTQLVINSLEREVKTIERAVLSSIESLGRRLAEASEAIEAGRTPSSCGIVQGMGTDLDSKVARLDQARSALASFKAATENDAKGGR
jgi:hypothetical protein